MTYRDRITIEPGKRGGKPCVRGVPIAEIRPLPKPPAHERPVGMDRGMTVPDSFFDPLPDEMLKAFGADGEAS